MAESANVSPILLKISVFGVGLMAAQGKNNHKTTALSNDCNRIFLGCYQLLKILIFFGKSFTSKKAFAIRKT